MADNEIIIDTAMNTDGVEKGIKYIKNGLKGLSSEVENIASSMRKAMSGGTGKEKTTEYIALEKELDALGAKYDKLAEQEYRFLQTGGSKKSGTYQRYEYDLDRIDQAQDEVIAKMREMEQAGTAYKTNIFPPVEEAERSNSAITELIERLNMLKSNLKTMESEGYTFGYKDYDNTYQSIRMLEDELKNYKAELNDVGKVQKEMNQPGSFENIAVAFKSMRKELKAVATVIKGVEKAYKTIKKAFASLGKAISKVTSVFGGLSNSLKGNNKGFASGFMKILKYTLGIRSLYILVNKLRSALTDGFKNLAQFNDGANQTNKDLSLLKSSLTQLKNSFAVAFAPILSYIVPTLNTMISTLSTAMNYLSMFLSFLGGKSTYTKAIKVQENYAESLDNTASSANKANKALAKFDDLDVLNNDKGGGGGSGADISPNDMFEEVPIDKSIFESLDPYEAGKRLSLYLKDIFENIDWNSIKNKAEEFGRNVAQFLNAVWDDEELAKDIGNSIAEALNTVLHFIKGFIEETNWLQLGHWLGTLIQEGIETFEWENAGEVLGDLINGLADAIIGFFERYEVGTLGEAIGNFINKAVETYDPKKVGEAIRKLIIGALTELTTLLNTTDFELLGKKVSDTLVEIMTGRDEDEKSLGQAIGDFIGAAFNAVVEFIGGLELGTLISATCNTISEAISIAMQDIDYEQLVDLMFELFTQAYVALVVGFTEILSTWGQEITRGWLLGILEAMQTINEWVRENIFNPFVDAIKNIFQIDSSSKVMKDYGVYIIKGLIDGINSMIGEAVKTVSNVSSSVLDTFKDVLGIHSPSKETQEIGDYLMQGLSLGMDGNAITDQIQTVCQTVIQTFSTYLNTENFYQIGIMMLTGLQTAWSEATAWFNEAMTTFWETFTTTYINYDMWYELLQNPLTAYTDVWTEFDSLWQSNITTWWSSYVEPYFTVEQWQLFGTNMRNGIMTGFKGIVSDVGGVLGKLTDCFNSQMKNIADAVNELVDKVNEMADELGISKLPHVKWSNVAKIQIPQLATGAVIPPNKKFLAMLGDQTHGTNIEAPLETIKQGLREVVAELGGIGGSQNAHMTLDGETFARLAIPYMLDELNRRGYDVSVLEG